MKITCKQFEELIPFYLNDELSENLKKAFLEHLHNCPNCHIKFEMFNSIVKDLKDAYNQISYELNSDEIIDIEPENITTENSEINSNLSAYIDNELSDDMNVEIRKNIISKPNLRKKIDKLYNLRKVITNSFNDEKTKLKTDFVKDTMKKLQTKQKPQTTFLHCFCFLLFVITVAIVSFFVIKSII
jgi:hypothetical protein